MPEVERAKAQKSDEHQLLEDKGRHQNRQRNSAERSVSFNRDVHVKRIGRGSPHVATTLVGDGESRFVTTPVSKERIKARSKEDLAEEAAFVLQQANSLDCFAEESSEPLRKYSSLPNRGKRSKQQRRRRREEWATTQSLCEELPFAEISKPKKKALERSVSDVGPGKIKQTFAKLFSPKLERKVRSHRQQAGPAALSRSQRDVGAAIDKSAHRKRSGSDSHQSSAHSVVAALPRTKKSLSPIIEVSPQVLLDPHQQPPFHFKAKKPKQQEDDDAAAAETIPIQSKPDGLASRSSDAIGVDQVDDCSKGMLHSSRYDQRGSEESTIRKMIRRLSNDRSPPPQFKSTMVSPAPGFSHNNNRPFSYTRPNESSPPPPAAFAQTDAIYAQVQMDKKKAQRSYSDSDEGLGLERKDSSRENSPAEKEYRRLDYYDNELQRINDINSFKSAATHFGDFEPTARRSLATKGFAPKSQQQQHEFETLDRNLSSSVNDKLDKDTWTIFVDTSSRGRANNGTDASWRDNTGGRLPPLNKTSELSARRDLLESRIKTRLLADEMFTNAKSGLSSLPKKIALHEIIDKPIVPTPVVPNRVASPKRYTDTYISETRTNSNGEKYIFEKEIHDENGKVYGYEKKITNKISADDYPIEPMSNEDYTLETRLDKNGDKYIIETRRHGSCSDDFQLSEQSRISPEVLDQLAPSFQSSQLLGNSAVDKSYDYEIPAPTSSSRKFAEQQRASKLSRRADVYQPRSKKSFEVMTTRDKSKSMKRLDELERTNKLHYVTRSHENLSSMDYVNTREMRKDVQRQQDELRKGPNDDYDTDISQPTNSQLESSSKYHKETRTSQRYLSSKTHADDYDSSPPRIRLDHSNGYSSSRYDSDTTARDSVHSYRGSKQRIDQQLQQHVLQEDLNKLDDSDVSRSKSSRDRLQVFDDVPPQRPPRAHHDSKLRHMSRHESSRTGYRHRETRVSSDPDRKDRLADSGIENDYRRDSQEQDSRREPFESEDEGFVTMQLNKQERRHTDRSMNLSQKEKQRYEDKYVMYYNDGEAQPLTTKPPLGIDAKKYEKKAAKKSGTMSKVKELFRKKEKKSKEEKSKKSMRANSTGALTNDEVSIRYREYRGDQLQSADNIRDLDLKEVSEDEFRQRRRLSTPSGSPSPSRASRLKRSTGTLTRQGQQYSEHTSSNRGSNQHQGQETERKSWFKSLSRKTKSSSKPVDIKQRLPESEILTTGTEDEEASSAPERVSVQKNLRFFGDTDQESISSNRDRRIKRGDNHAKARCQIANSSHHSRLTESALSSGESTTGDSSQQSQKSQRSVVYLHAATVGEIPGPNERRRAASREELSRPLTAHTRTVSRSVSVLAPWKPRHYRESYEINYDQQQHLNSDKPVTTLRRRQRSRETLNRRTKDVLRRGKDANFKTGTINRSTLKPKDKQKVDRTVSMESLASKSRNVSSRPELSRSTSVPRDPNKSAGWFKLKSKKSRA